MFTFPLLQNFLKNNLQTIEWGNRSNNKSNRNKEFEQRNRELNKNNWINLLILVDYDMKREQFYQTIPS